MSFGIVSFDLKFYLDSFLFLLSCDRTPSFLVIPQNQTHLSAQICSALKYVKRAVVGTCSTQDSASLKDWLDQRGFGNSEVHQQKGEEAHLVSVWRPAVPLGYGDDINDQSYKEAGVCFINTQMVSFQNRSKP
jgi:hypothetical protein